MQQIKGKISRNTQLTEDIFRMSIIAPEISTLALPGQFIMAKTSGNDPLLRRPFSIHQIQGNKIDILYKQVGKGTAILASLPPSSEIDIVGPLGNHFTWHNDHNCLIGGGMGVAPLLFLAQKMLKENIHPHIMLGMRNKTELTAILPNFEALGCPITYATDDGSMGHKGFIVECIQDTLPTGSAPWQVFTCGPYPMLKGIADLCRLQQWPCHVSMETMMACGISACLGCTIEANQANPKGGNYLHVCQDGPVFLANQIRWK